MEARSNQQGSYAYLGNHEVKTGKINLTQIKLETHNPKTIQNGKQLETEPGLLADK